MKFAKHFLNDETGATALEYGLILAILSLVVVSAGTVLFNTIAVKFNRISTTLGS